MAAASTESVPRIRAERRREAKESLGSRLMRYLPRGNLLDDQAWRQRHKVLQVFLLLHLPALAVFGLLMRWPVLFVAVGVAPIIIFLGLGDLARQRRLASFFITAGIVYCSTLLVVFSHGAIEAHFHFFIIIGFIALYQDWVPFLWNIIFVVLSHGIGSAFQSGLMFNHHDAMDHPWLWSGIHGAAVLVACIGMVLFWRTTEDEQQKTLALIKEKELGQAELNRRTFTSELLVNLARRNQSMLYRQLDIINQLEEHEDDPDALADLFRLDHLATRIRRNAESLLVLSGEEPPRVWSKPVQLTDVVRAAIAETEDLNRVVFVVDERLAVLGHAITDLTHLLAELIENAVRSSPPESRVTIRTTPDVRSPGTVVLTVEDWGVGMRPDDLLAANSLLAAPRDVDAVVSKQLGLHVVSRLARRYDIEVMLTSTSGSGITAAVLLPPELFALGQPTRAEPPAAAFGVTNDSPYGDPPRSARRAWPGEPDIHVDILDPPRQWGGWWESEDGELAVRALPSAAEYDGAPINGSNGFNGVHGPGAVNGSNGSNGSGSAGSNGFDRPAPPDPPAPRAARAGRAGRDLTGPLRLNQRTPQASLAPELQRGAQSGQDEPATPAPQATGQEAAMARQALSRYQASRQAALAEQSNSTGRDRS